ncbi:MAG: pyridoxine 5'-phosphate synthase [Saprospiraceae bacterium]
MSEVRLSVNLNKVALLRNARGGNLPDLIQVAIDCQTFGAEGITVHPRPDQRHVRYDDVPRLRRVTHTELNIEGNPDAAFLDMVLAVKPDQCTLVPDAAHQLTSDHGWDTLEQGQRLRELCDTLRSRGIRSSVFVDPDPAMIEGARAAGADRVELYTGPYAHDFERDPEGAVSRYVAAAKFAMKIGIGLNAGHDLNLRNLHFFKQRCPGLLEVSIGHALISDALYYGLDNTIKMYLRQLR